MHNWRQYSILIDFCPFVKYYFTTLSPGLTSTTCREPSALCHGNLFGATGRSGGGDRVFKKLHNINSTCLLIFVFSFFGSTAGIRQPHD
ncbi:MAG: hypothetical protein D3906_10330 [Candidatus Electrothrix sp. AUS1_2]|nr:hypothetical protein [Candidatus Electrothrix sp. AUS1_2]